MDEKGTEMEQENPNYLYHLKDDEPRRLIKPGNAAYNTDVFWMAPNYLQDTPKVFLMPWEIFTKAWPKH